MLQSWKWFKDFETWKLSSLEIAEICQGGPVMVSAIMAASSPSGFHASQVQKTI